MKATTRGMLVSAAMVVCAALGGCKQPTAERVVAQAEPVTAPVVAPQAAPPVAPAVTASPVSPAASSGHASVTAVTASAPEGSLTVRRLVITHGVKNREPVESDQPFRATGKKVYAFVEIDNHGHAPGEIHVEFEPPAGSPPHGDVSLAVGDGAHWRTWAYTHTAQAPGTWRVVVKSRKGEVLATATFDVVS